MSANRQVLICLRELGRTLKMANDTSFEPNHTSPERTSVREWPVAAWGERVQTFSDTPEGYFDTLPNRALAAVRFAQAADAMALTPATASEKQTSNWFAGLWASIESALTPKVGLRWVPAFAIVLVVGLAVIFTVPKFLNSGKMEDDIAANGQIVKPINADSAFAAIPTDEALAYLDANPPSLTTLSGFLGFTSESASGNFKRTLPPQSKMKQAVDQVVDSLRTPTLNKSSAPTPGYSQPQVTDEYIKQLLQSAPDEALEEEVLLLL